MQTFVNLHRGWFCSLSSEKFFACELGIIDCYEHNFSPVHEERRRKNNFEHPKTITSYDPVTFVLLSEVPKDLMFIREI